MTKFYFNTIINFFHCAPILSEPSTETINHINTKAIKVGKIIAPRACNEITEQYIKEIDYNPNSTFYKTWDKIKDTPRVLLLMDQLLHYASTYGTDYEAETYCPNEDPVKVDYKRYTVIEAVTKEELFNKIMNVLQSGIALDSETVRAFCKYLIDYKVNKYDIDINTIKNREAITYLCTHLHIFPNNPLTLLNVIYYICTGQTMVVKDYTSIRLCGWNANRIDLSLLNQEQIKGLSTIFNRYKPIFVALKKHQPNKHVVNRISKLSKKYHKPFKVGFWENFTNLPYITPREVQDQVNKLTSPFKIVKLLEMIKLHKLQALYGLPRTFLIRNNKTWVNEYQMVPYPCNFDYTAEMLLSRLIDLMAEVKSRTGVKTIKLPACTLTCPSSEKKFIGNIPIGSYYDLKDCNNYFGIYWKNEWGTRDFDLSIIQMSGEKIGWNSWFNHGGVLFSGDMTNADPEATEMLYIPNKCPNGAIYINRYNGDPGSKFKLFFGQDKCEGFKKNYMVDPSTITFEDIIKSGSTQQIIGCILEDRVYFLRLSQGESAISRSAKDLNFLKSICLSHIELEPILKAVGYKIVDSEADVDLSTLDSGKILSLFVF